MAEAKPVLEKNLYLVGFMGAGKSTVARLLAQRLSAEFVDTDGLVEQEAGETIANIFSAQGEARFRDLESQAIARAARKRQAVVALGGGAVLRERNWKWMRRSGISVYLKTDICELTERLADARDRPLLTAESRGNRPAAIEKLYNARKRLYERADFTIECQNFSPEQIVDEILDLINAHA